MIKFPICIVLGVCLLANDAYSQDQKIVDSLNAVLADKKGGERFPALYELTFQYVASDKERALRDVGLGRTFLHD